MNEIERILLEFDLALPHAKGGITLAQATQQISDLIKQREVEARLDELKKFKAVFATDLSVGAYEGLTGRITELTKLLKGTE